jgi:hypothetical protein
VAFGSLLSKYRVPFRAFWGCYFLWNLHFSWLRFCGEASFSLTSPLARKSIDTSRFLRGANEEVQFGEADFDLEDDSVGFLDGLPSDCEFDRQKKAAAKRDIERACLHWSAKTFWRRELYTADKDAFADWGAKITSG